MKRASPSIKYCVDYVRDVQETGKYNEFLQLIEKFKDLRRLDTDTVEFHLKYTVLSERIKQIFKRHSELLPKFKPFLPDGYEVTVAVDQADGHDDDEAELLHQEYSFFEKAKTSLRSPNEYKQFLKISKDEFHALTGFTYTQNEEVLRRTTKSTGNKSGDCDKDERAKLPKRRRLVEEPKSLIAGLSEFVGENPSYKRSTRKNNQVDLASIVSNDLGDDGGEVHYEPKKKPTETSSEYFEHSIYQANLFKFTIERAEELLAKIDDNCSLIHIEDHFSVPHLGCIKRLFGKLGQNVMQKLLLPLITTRLHQKLQEVSTSLLNSEKELKLVSSKNSSLEHLGKNMVWSFSRWSHVYLVLSQITFSIWSIIIKISKNLLSYLFFSYQREWFISCLFLLINFSHSYLNI
ncbi:hypothetical protein MKW92_023247 [Papaver armeniacum]|nr:hypothetical protein MKW92_023247 [Papaver armeniacum]